MTHSSSFLLAYKSSLHPISKVTYSDIVDSLRSQCCLKIIKNPVLIDSINDTTLPRDLFGPLMSAALSLTSDVAVIKLIKKWPSDRLILQDLSSPIFVNVKHLYDQSELAESMRKSIKQTTSLAHNTIESLKANEHLNLKYLDLSAFPAADIIVNYLASHVMLAHNEMNQQEIIDAYYNITDQYNITDRKSYTVLNSLSNKRLTVAIDAIIMTEDVHMELCRALSINQKYGNCPINIIIKQLDASSLGVARIVVLLEIVNVKFLHSISLQNNEISNEALSLLQPIICNLVNLRTLDLSKNSIFLRDHPNSLEQVTKLLGFALSSLVHLDSLDLSGNRLGFSISILFQALNKPFKVLRLKDCGLQPVDIKYMLAYLPLHELRELDLGVNVFTNLKILLTDFVKKCSANLVVLELEDIQISELELFNFFNEVSYLKNLKYLNVAMNPVLNKQILFDSLCYFFMTKQLQAVKMSYPLEIITMHQENVMLNFEKKMFSAQVEFLLLSLCNMHSRPSLVISFV